MNGAPGRATWARTRPLKDSALPCTIVPAKVAGAEPQAWGGRKVNQGDAVFDRKQHLFHGRIIVLQRGDRLGVLNDARGFFEVFFTPADEQSHIIYVALTVGVLAAEDQRFFTVGQGLAHDDAIGDIRRLIIGHTDDHRPIEIGQGIGQGSGDAAMLTGET